jgi:hypothetical protein
VDLVHRLEPDWIATAPLGNGDEVFRELLLGPAAATKTMLVN